MLDFLLKYFVKDYHDVKSPKVRDQYGRLSGIVGIMVNVFLFMIKFAVGTWSHSISITGDAFNNLSDAGSSVIALVSFKLSGKPPDKEHPFGHARYEYIASSVVGFLILLIGWELIKSSYHRILQPGAIEFSLITVGVLTFSIIAKYALYRLNKNLGQRINSSIMQATAVDSLSDVASTSAVLASTIISPLLGFQLDGYMGLAVAGFVIISAVRILKDMLDSLLGKMPSGDFIRKLVAYIEKYDGVLGTHDLVVHDYGPHRCFASVHVEVDAGADILESHDLIDNIERDVALELGVPLVIHMDPIVRDDPWVNEMYRLTGQLIKEIDTSLSIHDFRIVKGRTHSNIIFDVTVPFECKMGENSLVEKIKYALRKTNPHLIPVITIDRAYVVYPGHDK